MQKYNQIIYNKSSKIKQSSLLYKNNKVCIDENIDAINERDFKSIECYCKYKSLHIIGRPIKASSHFTRNELNDIRNELLKIIKL